MTLPASPGGAAAARGSRFSTGPLLVVWPVIAALLILTPAVWLHKSTEVDIQLLLSRISFRIREPLQTGLFGTVPARSVTVVSFGAIDLGPGRFDGQLANPASVANSIRIIAADPLARTTLDAVTVQEMRVASGTRITMEWEGADQAGDSQALALNADGDFTARFAPQASRPLSIRTCVGCRIDGLPAAAATLLDRPVEFIAAGDPLMSLSSPKRLSDGRGLGMTIRLELEAGSSLAETVIPIPDGINTTTSEGAKPVSSVVQGAINYPGFGLPARELKQGDVVLLGDVPDLRILSLQITKGILVRLHGHATHVSVGPPGFVADTVPSWFQWYMSSLLPYLHATLALAAAALALYQKFKTAPSGEARA